jgi:hypothetical protein
MAAEKRTLERLLADLAMQEMGARRAAEVWAAYSADRHNRPLRDAWFAAVVELRAAGVTERTLADATGLHRSRIAQIAKAAA